VVKSKPVLDRGWYFQSVIRISRRSVCRWQNAHHLAPDSVHHDEHDGTRPVLNALFSPFRRFPGP
jgi:hypothetical protein